MTRLFLKFYVGILIVLLLAWYVHGYVTDVRSSQELSRVVELAHQGSARLVANELNVAMPSRRESVLEQLQQRYDYPVSVVSIEDLPEHAQTRLAESDDVVFFGAEGVGSFVATSLQSDSEAVLLGPMPEFTHIEQSLQGGVRLAIARLDAVDGSGRAAALDELQTEFGYPMELVDLGELLRRNRDE